GVPAWRGLLRRRGADRPRDRPCRVLLRRLLLRSVRASGEALRGTRARADRARRPPCPWARGGGAFRPRRGLQGVSRALRRASRLARSAAWRRAPRTLPRLLAPTGHRALRGRSRARVAASGEGERCQGCVVRQGRDYLAARYDATSSVADSIS